MGVSEGLNRVTLLGNLGQDPELRYTQSGSAVLNMRIATTETYFDQDRNKKERTDWHNVVVWGKRAEALGKILTKGSGVLVEGSIRNSSFEGRDGQKRYKTEISARNIVLVGGGGPRRNAPAAEPDYPEAHDDPSAGSTPPTDAFGTPDDDDIPF